METIENEFVLTIDYSRTWDEMIAAGNYDAFASNIRYGFPYGLRLEDSRITVKVRAKLFKFDDWITRDQAIVELAILGYRFANLPELLALGEADPELQRQFSIIALAEPWVNYSSVDEENSVRVAPYLGFDYLGRRLGYEYADRKINPKYRFLAIRKEN